MDTNTDLDIGVTIHMLGVNADDYASGKLATKIYLALRNAGLAEQVIVEDLDEMEN